ncbi:hypothetical protein, unlikely [Trypanosoma brucei gambiense DAL972]|uniref:Uncharacterized protein n=1 Tax=Trypanosoma brucei gambiense (strain MHOM/CI/86/DAL972) TaxID=679716 RepID=C9ZWM8_TRYB9|nr:hypothetical protein, unlikely [Trypanosoma brucei gambiense DAL972]CBH13817.1 hypothetical protein, unlikely [Trypanosoma brucei gambiense DAL972]|eukprot:XP_011776093.1 hypothetical protein, unlikely [Trypanosoma brucei gambiense DAL972]
MCVCAFAVSSSFHRPCASPRSCLANRFPKKKKSLCGAQLICVPAQMRHYTNDVPLQRLVGWHSTRRLVTEDQTKKKRYQHRNNYSTSHNVPAIRTYGGKQDRQSFTLILVFQKHKTLACY